MTYVESGSSKGHGAFAHDVKQFVKHGMNNVLIKLNKSQDICRILS